MRRWTVAAVSLLALVAAAAAVEVTDIQDALRWGQTGDFAGFTFMFMMPKQCDWALNKLRIANQSAYDAVVDTCEELSARNLQSIMDDPVTGLNGKNWRSAYAVIQAALTAAGGLNTLRRALKASQASMCEACPGEDRAKIADCNRVSSIPVTQSLGPMESTLDDGTEILDRRRLLELTAKDMGKQGLAGFVRLVLHSFLGPIRDVAFVLSKIPPYGPLKLFRRLGQLVYNVFNPGTARLKDLENSLQKVCTKVEKTVKAGQRFDTIITSAKTSLSLWQNLVVMPLSYETCRQEKLIVSQLVGKYQRGEQLQSCPRGSMRRQLLDTSPAVGAGAYPVEVDARTLAQATESARQSAAAMVGSLASVASIANSSAAAALNATATKVSAQAQKLGIALDQFGNLVDKLNNIPPGLLDVMHTAGAVFGNVNPCAGPVGSFYCNAGDAMDEFVENLVPDSWKAKLQQAEEDMRDAFLNGLDIPDVFSDVDIGLPDLSSFVEDFNALLQSLNSTATALAAQVFSFWITSDVILLGGNPTPDTALRAAMSRSATNITLSCPLGWRAYVKSATYSRAGCQADMTSLMRFPCTAATTEDNTARQRSYCKTAFRSVVSAVCGSTQQSANTTRLGFSGSTVVEYVCVQPGSTSFRLLPQLRTMTRQGDTSQRITYATSDPNDGESVSGKMSYMRSRGSWPVNTAPGVWTTPPTFTCLSKLPTPYSAADVYARQRRIVSSCPAASDAGTCDLGACIQWTQPMTFFSDLNPSLTASAGPTFRARTQGSLVLESMRAPDSTLPPLTCTGAASFGLPTLLLDGFDMDPCFVRPSGAPSGTQALASTRRVAQDLCAWRHISRTSPKQGANHEYAALLAGMVPPMLLPWSSTPNMSAFADWWHPREVCEFFENADAPSFPIGTRSMWGGRGWPARRLGTMAECIAATTRPSCMVGCDALASSPGSTWPLVDPMKDPATMYNYFGPPTQPTDDNFAAVCAMPDAAFYDNRRRPTYPAPKRSITFDGQTCTCSQASCPFYYCPGCNTVCSKEMAWRCAWDMTMQNEALARREELQKYNALLEAMEAGRFDQAGLDTVAACNLTKGSCNTNSLFSASPFIGSIKYACVEDSAASSGSSASGESVVTLAFYDTLTPAPKTITCPVNSTISLASAELGQGLDIKVVLREVVQSLCTPNGRSCTLDATHSALGAKAGDTLRIEWSCVCVAGFAQLPSNGTCTPCKAGTYRSANMASCELSPEGTFVPSPGAAAPTPCPPGSFQSYTGSTSCSLCWWGTASTAVGAMSADACQPCGPNTVAASLGATACEPCPLGFFRPSLDVNLTGIVCEACPPGSWRGAESMLTCELCPPGSYSVERGATNCTAAPAGSFVATAGMQSPLPCPIAFYADRKGQARCQQCPDGQTTRGIGSRTASSCQPLPVLPGSYADMLADQGNASFGCEAFLRKWWVPAVNTTNITELLMQVGDSVCSPGLLNGAACGYDGGDCCPGTCDQACVQSSATVIDSAGLVTYATYTAVLGSCLFFDCKDPAAKALPPKPGNCSGTLTALTSLPEQLHAMQQAKAAAGVPNAGIAISLGEAAPQSAIGNGVCDVSLNNEANSFDGGDCCPRTCSRVDGSGCTYFMCLDPAQATASTSAADVVPPVLVAPKPLMLQCGEVLPQQEATATDDTDAPANIDVSGPSLLTSHSIGGIALGAALPCAEAQYTVNLAWTARDRAGNSANASQRITVLAVSTCSGPLPPVDRGSFPANSSGIGIGAVVAAVCEGLNASTPPTTRCLPGGQFSAVNGSCPKVCLGLPPITAPNTTWADCNGTAEGSFCTGKCTGNLTGSPQVACSAAGWAGTVVGSPCVAPPSVGVCAKVPPGTPVNAMAWPSSCAGATVGAACRAICRMGYTSPPPTSLCTAKGWTEPVPQRCQLVCSRPPPDTAAISWPSTCANTELLGGCVGTCTSSNARYGAPQRRCVSGAWSPQTYGTCLSVPNCASQLLLSVLSGSFATNTSAQCLNTPVGARCRAVCNPGFGGPDIPSVACVADPSAPGGGAWNLSSLTGRCTRVIWG